MLLYSECRSKNVSLNHMQRLQSFYVFAPNVNIKISISSSRISESATQERFVRRFGIAMKNGHILVSSHFLWSLRVSSFHYFPYVALSHTF